MADQLGFSVIPRSLRRRDDGGFRETAPTAPEAPATRSFGFQSGAGPGEKMAAARAPELAGAGAALGEPTSFRGGAGAPPPVEVVRGARTTFVNPAPDSPGGGYNPTAARNTQEFASPLQAGQAYNRGERAGFVATHPTRENLTYPPGTSPEEQATAKYGEFRVPGQTVAEIQATKEGPGATAARNEQAGLFKAQREGVEATNRKTEIANNQSTLRKQLEEEVGVPDATGKNLSLPTDQNFQAIHKEMDRLTMQGVSPDEAYKAVAPKLHKLYYTPENIYGAISAMEKQTGQPMTPELRKQLMSGTPEAMKILYPYTRQAAQQPRGVVARTFSPAPAVGPAATQPVVPAAVSPPVAGAFRPSAPQPFAGAAEQGEAAGVPAGTPVNLGPGFGKPLGGFVLPDRY